MKYNKIVHIPYDLVVFDLEMNQPSGTIIQIGAVKVDRHLQLGTEFYTHSKSTPWQRNIPRCFGKDDDIIIFDDNDPFTMICHTKEVLGKSNYTDKSITELTGISQEMVEKAPSFSSVFTQFDTWARQPSKNILLACWGTDAIHLKNEYNKHLKLELNKEYPFRNKFIDVRQIVLGVCWSLYGHGPTRESLYDFFNFFDLTLGGTPHDALHDALNTARLLTHVIGQFQNKLNILQENFLSLIKP